MNFRLVMTGIFCCVAAELGSVSSNPLGIRGAAAAATDETPGRNPPGHNRDDGGCPDAGGSGIPATSGNFFQLHPVGAINRIFRFWQIEWELENYESGPSRWGLLSLDQNNRRALEQFEFSNRDVYLNVITIDQNQSDEDSRALWVMQNMVRAVRKQSTEDIFNQNTKHVRAIV